MALGFFIKKLWKEYQCRVQIECSLKEKSIPYLFPWGKDQLLDLPILMSILTNHSVWGQHSRSKVCLMKHVAEVIWLFRAKLTSNVLIRWFYFCTCENYNLIHKFIAVVVLIWIINSKHSWGIKGSNHSLHCLDSVFLC